MQALAPSRENMEFDARLCFLTGMQIIYVAFWTELGPARFAADTMTTPAWGTAGAESQAKYILHNVCWTACHILMCHQLNAHSHSTFASCMCVNLGQLEQQCWSRLMEGLHACLLQPHSCQAFQMNCTISGPCICRYAGKAARERCPELQGDTADLCCPAEDLDNLPEVQTFPHA